MNTNEEIASEAVVQPVPVDPIHTQMIATRQSILERLDKRAEISQTYTTVVVFGGYAALLAIWGYTREVLNPWDIYWSAGWLLISITVFVSFEVYKVVVSGAYAFEVSKFLAENNDPATFFDNLNAVNSKLNVFTQTVLHPLWIVVLYFTIIPALLSSFILVKACALGLITLKL